MDAVKHCEEGEVREMATSTLSVLVRSSQDIAAICRGDEELMKILMKRTREMTKENVSGIRSISYSVAFH